MRREFFLIFYPLTIFLALGAWFYPFLWWLLGISLILTIIGTYDALQTKHTILRNFPLLGHLRYWFEAISPEIQQYFIERHTDGTPFSQNQRALVYSRGKEQDDTHPFGTELDLYDMDYEGLLHSTYPAAVLEVVPRIKIGGKSCKQPYEASLLNVSAMSFGAISSHAIMALGKAAKKGGFYINTGEGGLSKYHLKEGADVVWQVGTGYFGCRTKEGGFDPKAFKKNATHEQVKMIELKISQGAKPGHGGILPAIKNTEEIAAARGIEPHTTVYSPPGHKTFSDAKGLLEFVQQLRELSGYKPVGFKLCLGKPKEFDGICQQMKESGIMPDFITVDGAEGGTGASPLEFTDSTGVPLEPALIYIDRTLKKHGLRKELKIIASGKVLTAISLLRILALGADLCNAARAFMFSVGCIQALRCNTNHCPTGVATQDPVLIKGLVIDEKSERTYHFHRNTLKAAADLLAASGKTSFEEMEVDSFIRGDSLEELENKYFKNESFI